MVNKKPEEEEIQGEIVETKWDPKKIAIGVVALILLMIIGSYVLFPVSSIQDQSPRSGTLGVSSSDTQNSSDVPPLPSQEDIGEIIDSAKSTLSEITSENLTSSQAAIQKIITDLESLQEKKAIGVICDMVCKNN